MEEQIFYNSWFLPCLPVTLPHHHCSSGLQTEKEQGLYFKNTKYSDVLQFLILFQTVSPPASPGAASLGVPPPQRSRGYSALEDDQDEDRAPLTPATQQAQSFQY